MFEIDAGIVLDWPIIIFGGTFLMLAFVVFMQLLAYVVSISSRITKALGLEEEEG